MARVVIAGAGQLGTALQRKLEGSHEVRAPAVDLTSIPDTEVALAGAEVVVFLARARAPVARFARAAPADLDLLLTDTVARAAQRVGARHVIHFACGADDPRTRLLEKAGLPLTVIRGGGPDPVEALARAVAGEPAGVVESAAWARDSEIDPSRAPRFSTASVQRFRRPGTWNALELVRAYFRWLPGAMPLVKASERSGVFTVSFAGVEVLRMRFVAGRSEADCAWLELSGGALRGDGPQGRFEFRCLLDSVTACITLVNFGPALPFPVYRFTQALLHERVMRRFSAWAETQT